MRVIKIVQVLKSKKEFDKIKSVFSVVVVKNKNIAQFKYRGRFYDIE